MNLRGKSAVKGARLDLQELHDNSFCAFCAI